MVLVGREADLPYERPPLSKGYLRGTESRERALVRDGAWYEGNDVEVLTRTSAMKLDLEARSIKQKAILHVFFL